MAYDFLVLLMEVKEKVPNINHCFLIYFAFSLCVLN